MRQAQAALTVVVAILMVVTLFEGTRRYQSATNEGKEIFLTVVYLPRPALYMHIVPVMRV